MGVNFLSGFFSPIMSSSDFSNIFDMIVFVVGILTLDWVGLFLVEIFFFSSCRWIFSSGGEREF